MALLYSFGHESVVSLTWPRKSYQSSLALNQRGDADNLIRVTSLQTMRDLEYTGNRLIHPRLMQPTAYYIQIAWHGIFLILSHYKNLG